MFGQAVWAQQITGPRIRRKPQTRKVRGHDFLCNQCGPRKSLGRKWTETRQRKSPVSEVRPLRAHNYFGHHCGPENHCAHNTLKITTPTSLKMEGDTSPNKKSGGHPWTKLTPNTTAKRKNDTWTRLDKAHKPCPGVDKAGQGWTRLDKAIFQKKIKI